MARIAVVGGTGFLGSHVVHGLDRLGHEVAVLSRGLSPASLPPRVLRITADRHRLADSAAALRAFAPEIVVDMILSSGTQARELMAAVRGVARRVVAVSSMDVYRACGVLHGLEPGPLEPLPLTESSPLRTRLFTYPSAQIARLRQVFGWLDDGYDKIPVELAVMDDADVAGTVLRLPMVYGPGDPLHRCFPILKRVDDGRRVIPLEASQARFRAPRGYVENVAAAVVLAATDDRAAGRIYNVGEPDCLGEAEWTRLVAAAAGWRGDVVELPAERAPAHLRSPARLEQHWVADTSRIRAELGYQEPVARSEAILRTVESERHHPPAQIDPAAFDYAAEDAALATGGP